MKILLIGTVKFSEIVFKQLIQMKADITGICTSRKSNFNSDHVSLKKVAEKHHIPCLETNDINSDYSVSWIKKRDPSIIFCFGWSRIVGDEILNIPKLGVIGFHPALLPFNRGRHPIIWALVLGLKETASTFFLMDKKPDTGDVISQERVPIFFEDDANILYKRISNTATKQLRNIIPKLESGDIKKIKQSNVSGNFWRKRNFADGQIDWRMSAENIYNLVRGLSKPYVGAHFYFDDNIIKVWSTKIELNVPKNLEPGKVLDVNRGKILVKTGDFGLWLIKFNPYIITKPGKYL